MKSRVEDEFDRIIEIQEDGETKWSVENEICRDKISQESRDKQKKAIENNDLETRVQNLEKIILGKEIHNG